MKGHMNQCVRAFASILVATLAACAEQVPAGPDEGDIPTPSFSTQGPGQQGLKWQYADEHIVLFRGRMPADLDTRIAGLGGSVLRTHPEIGVAIVTGLSDAAAAELASAPGILAVPRDVSVKAIPDLAAMRNVQPQSAPSGPPTPAGHDPTTAVFFGLQWDMQVIDAADAWNAGFNDASGVRVAIVDTGLDPFHQDISGNIDAGSSIAFVPSVNPAGPDWGDDNAHGTHVGGTVTTNGIGTSGVAPHATLIAVKVCGFDGFCSVGAILSGILHAADEDADVINLSLGLLFSVPAPLGGLLNAAYSRAVNYADSRGALVVSAAGNGIAGIGVDLDHVERDLGAIAVLSAPCESGSGICVSATGPDDVLASYSNYGRSAIDVAAPGGDFIDTFDPITSMVFAPCSSLTVDPFLAICTTSPNWYVTIEGTSQATPHVAGAAALLDAQYGGGLNAGRLKSALERTADDLGKRGADPQYGAGRINVCNLLGC